MTLQEARKVIGLNIHNLNGSMQMAVATIMDALEDMMKDDAVPADETPEYQEGYSEGRKDAFEEFEIHAVEGKVVNLADTYDDLSVSVEGKELNEVLQPLGVKDGDKVKVIIVKEDMI